MRIGFFLQNNRKGGVDTFVINLVNHWPDADDELMLICNATHPGIETIRSAITRPLSINLIDISPPLAAHGGGQFSIPTIISKAWVHIKRVAYFPWLVWSIRHILEDAVLDRLLVVNGGYPGAEACRAASIAWGRWSTMPKSWHNFHNFAIKPRQPLTIWENWIDGMVDRYSAGWISVSHSCAASLNNRAALKNTEVQVIYNGIQDVTGETNKNLRRELGIDQDAPICLMLASYEPRKGHEFLIRAFAKAQMSVPEAHLIMCGHGTEDEIKHVQRLQREIAPQENIHLLEFRSDIGSLLAQAQVLAVASQAFESFGLTSIEAMSMGIPVLATNVGGIPEVVKNDEGGYCVPHDDVDIFSDHLTLLLQDAELRRTQGQKGRQRYLRNFTSERMAREYANLLWATRGMADFDLAPVSRDQNAH